MSSNRLLIVIVLLVLAGCGDNLLPSGDDRRPSVIPGTTGPSPGQTAPLFSLPSTDGSTVTTSSAIDGVRGAVFYFTMWCPVCDSHMNHLRFSIAPDFPDVRFFLVDYVSGSVGGAAQAAAESGFAGGSFRILSDASQAMLTSFGATMGTTIVIDAAGVVRMNEDYRDGTPLRNVLTLL